MSDSEEGKSGMKAKNILTTQEELERYLLDSDNDIFRPDCEESDAVSGSSSDSDDPELD